MRNPVFHLDTKRVNPLGPYDEHHISSAVASTLDAIDSAQAAALAHDEAIDDLSRAALRIARGRDRGRCVIDVRPRALAERRTA